jgi:ribonuclease HI
VPIIAFKYYAVAKGRHPGIYTSWPACRQEVQGFEGAHFKGFNELTTAKQWLIQPVIKSQAEPTEITQQKFAKTAEVFLWTDGGCRNHGNQANQHVKKNDPAAWAYLVKTGTDQYAASAGECGATNNRMEIMALYQALIFLQKKNLNHKTILAVLDSKYVLNALTAGWLKNWQNNGWQTQAGKKVANQELWQQLAVLLPKFSQLSFTWTKGHAANPGNVFVDQLLNKTMDQMKVK